MRKVIFFSILFVLLAGTVYVYWYYYKVYHSDTLHGRLLRFSRKGYLFRTWEGQLQYSTDTIGNGNKTGIFYFSVADAGIADSLAGCTGKKLSLHYVQYLRSLPWRGAHYNADTTGNRGHGQYIVDKIEGISN